MNLPFRVIFLLLVFACNQADSPPGQGEQVTKNNQKINIKEVNSGELAANDQLIAIERVRVIDGTGKDPLEDAVVIIRGNVFAEIGDGQSTTIPADAKVVDGSGFTLLPGLIDAHFHLDGNNQYPRLFLRNGITSLRDPGAWIESYDSVRKSGNPVPRLFLTGPHLDMPPPAYPSNSYLIRDMVEAHHAVNSFIDQGASAIKVYFRLPVSIIEAVCRTAHKRGIPVTAHLEITKARDAIEAGVDGIEHVTSFGSDLLPTYFAQQYQQSILADNNARREGRYQVWNAIDVDGHRVDSLIAFLKDKGTVVSPTLGAFEYRFSDQNKDSIKHQAFQNMMAFVGKLSNAGVPIVVGSHSWVPYAEVGWAYHHEMELLAESGLTNKQIISAATLENARFLKIDDRLGSIQVGKQADLIMIDGDPLEDIGTFHHIERVMLHGKWID